MYLFCDNDFGIFTLEKVEYSIQPIAFNSTQKCPRYIEFSNEDNEDAVVSDPPVKKFQSKLWKYYQLSNSGKAKCKACGALIDRKKSTTFRMRDHLNRVHGFDGEKFNPVKCRIRRKSKLIDSASTKVTSDIVFPREAIVPRQCPYCKIVCKVKWRRHIRRLHRHEKDVAEILLIEEKEKLLGAKVSVSAEKFFRKLRNESIPLHDLAESMKERPEYKTRKQSRNVDDSNTMKYCSHCSVFISAAKWNQHLKIDCKNSTSIPAPIICLNSEDMIHKEFDNEVLAGLRMDDIGKKIMTSDGIKSIGRQMWRKHRENTEKWRIQKEVVRKDMRFSAKLLMIVNEKNEENHSIEDLFKRDNFESILEALRDINVDNYGNSKAGGRQYLSFTIKRLAKFVQIDKHIQKCDCEADEIGKFLEKWREYESILFAGSIQKTNLNKQIG